MKSVFMIALTVATLYILQSLPAYRLTDMAFSVKWMRMQADIACIFCVYLGVREESILRGTMIAFMVGILASAFSPSSLRVFVLLCPIFFLLSSIANICFYFRRLESYILLVFTMSLLYNHSFFYVMRRISDWNVSHGQMFWSSVTQALMNAFFGAVIFTFFDWIIEVNRNARQGAI